MENRTAVTGLWLCSSCAGWYYDYCNPKMAMTEMDGYPQCFKDGRIIICPYRHYHFIPTKHYSSLHNVIKTFPTEF